MPRKGPATIEDRLNRVEGQIRTINKMVQNDANMAQILVQLHAAISSLESLRLEIIKKEIKENIVGNIAGQIDTALTQLK